MSRRAVGRWALLLVAAVLLASAVVLVVGRGGGDDPRVAPTGSGSPPAASGLLPWAPRGELASDRALLARAADVWRSGRLADGRSAPVPAGDVYPLWAGSIGAGRVLLLQGVAADGTGLLAQVSEHGEPAALGLDRVEDVPAAEPAALAVTYDGNLDLTGLSAGAGSALIQLLATPTGETRSLWQQRGRSGGESLRLLDVDTDGMSETFLHLGDEQDPGTVVVLGGTVGGRAGIAATIEVRPLRLVPSPAVIELADAATWGPSGRIDGGEYRDALAAVEAVGATRATVHEILGETVDGDGEELVVRLLEVASAAGPTALVLVATDASGDLLCLSADGPLPVRPESSAPVGHRLVAQQCLASARDLRVIAVAAPEGEGPVRLSGSGAPPEPVQRLVEVHSYTDRVPRVATLVDEPEVAVTLPPGPAD